MEGSDDEFPDLEMSDSDNELDNPSSSCIQPHHIAPKHLLPNCNTILFATSNIYSSPCACVCVRLYMWCVCVCACVCVCVCVCVWGGGVFSHVLGMHG